MDNPVLKTYKAEEGHSYTDKEKLFCYYYVQYWNGAKAAREAGYKESNDRGQASENLSKPHIKQLIEEMKSDLEFMSGVSKLRNLQELGKIAYLSAEDVYTTEFTLEEFNNLSEQAKSAIMEVENTQRVISSEGENIVIDKKVKVKFYSKQQAIQEINKMMGYNEPDKVEHSGGLEHKFKGMSDSEVEAEAKRIREKYDD